MDKHRNCAPVPALPSSVYCGFCPRALAVVFLSLDSVLLVLLKVVWSSRDSLWGGGGRAEVYPRVLIWIAFSHDGLFFCSSHVSVWEMCAIKER